MAEIELSILSKQCLSRRLANEWILITEIMAWEERRNLKKATISWNITNQDARMAFKDHYATSFTC